jgi:hypothetical protein
MRLKLWLDFPVVLVADPIIRGENNETAPNRHFDYVYRDFRRSFVGTRARSRVRRRSLGSVRRVVFERAHLY